MRPRTRAGGGEAAVVVVVVVVVVALWQRLRGGREAVLGRTGLLKVKKGSMTGK